MASPTRNAPRAAPGRPPRRRAAARAGALVLSLGAAACNRASAPGARPGPTVRIDPPLPLPTPSPAPRAAPDAPAPSARLAAVATLADMPTAIAVTRGGRVFVALPRRGAPTATTLVEVRGGAARAYPDAATNRAPAEEGDPARRLVSVEGLAVDARERLWVLDAGGVGGGAPLPGGPKLVAIDLGTDRVVRALPLPPTIAPATSHLTEVRLDLRRGAEGVAYLADASEHGGNAIVVIDLATGAAQRRLVDHPALRAAPGFIAIVEGRPVALAAGVDGLALSPDGGLLYLRPLASRRLYAVPTAALVDPARADADVAAMVQDLGDVGAVDGLDADAAGRLYLAMYEEQAIARRLPDGTIDTLVRDPRLAWPAAVTIADDGHLYVVASQLHRQARFRGLDERIPPFGVFRLRVDAPRLRDEPPTRTSRIEP